ncbi:hypothetical protein [Klebsiella michiganensis]|uniref:hypothetical protein n=1 Tax=Klebsiella michiganensis TaxID=1134687 RepID=UPI000668E6CD|nr:hypothetical protein [Klebsiella michiganensis]
MTSKLTREERVQALYDLKVGQVLSLADIENVKMLSRMALAAMDSEPVIVVGDDGGDALSYRRLIQSFEPGTKLYRHAQLVPVVSADLLHTAASAIEDLLTTKDRTGACVWFDLPFRLRSAANAHSAPVVPDGLIAAVNRLLDSDGSRGCYSATQCGDAHDEIERLLAAAQQEVKDGK